jgi:FAD/FMN-containing dehydrogenase
VQTIATYTQSDMLLHNGNLRRLVEFTFKVGAKIDREREASAEFDTVLDEQQGRVETVWDKLLVQGLKRVRENGWNIESDAESGGISLVGITGVGE